MGYSWDIRGVFTGYTYVSVMYRLCVGYVSGMCRNILGESRFVDNLVENNDDHYNKEEFFLFFFFSGL